MRNKNGSTNHRRKEPQPLFAGATKVRRPRGCRRRRARLRPRPRSSIRGSGNSTGTRTNSSGASPGIFVHAGCRRLPRNHLRSSILSRRRRIPLGGCRNVSAGSRDAFQGNSDGPASRSDRQTNAGDAGNNGEPRARAGVKALGAIAGERGMSPATWRTMLQTAVDMPSVQIMLVSADDGGYRSRFVPGLTGGWILMSGWM
ncbi:hypothetical protein C8Q74DRAFT_647792 [Fomes fomentarius]|nr:hypothetical protein C8Q74DRAFT_647792 [Fomes fomentarius]